MHSAIHVHKALLGKWRKAMDLIGPGPMEPHFEDANSAVHKLGAEGNWIALAAHYPEAHVLMVESRQKRVLFLKRVIQESKLPNVSIYHGRSEDLDQTFHGVISRAYRKPLAYLDDARRLSKPNARTVLLLGGDNPFVPPRHWRICEDSKYTISTGSRRRLILCADRE